MAGWIPFVKMQGTGNDFIMIDNRRGILKEKELAEFARRVCARRVSVGADGVELLEKSRVAQYKMRLFNSDGSEAEMCGNGARCMARFARDLGAAGKRQTFETLAGIIRAEVTGEGAVVDMPLPGCVPSGDAGGGAGACWASAAKREKGDRKARARAADAAGPVRLDIREFKSVEISGRKFDIYFLNTGVPHAVVFVDAVKDCDAVNWGREIRRHPLFGPKGTNANFVEVRGRSEISVRTYERGVEDETLACGTGSTAAALAAAAFKACRPPVRVKTSGGDALTVHFQLDGGMVSGVKLEGPVTVVCRGELHWRP